MTTDDDGRGLMLDYVEARLGDQDRQRSAYLAEAMKREPIIGELCMRGHDDWGERLAGDGGRIKRYCRTCHAMEEKARRARARRAA